MLDGSKLTLLCAVCLGEAKIVNKERTGTLCGNDLCFDRFQTTLNLGVGTYGDLVITVAPYKDKPSVLYIDGTAIWTESFYVTYSLIPGANFGLFANRDFKGSKYSPILEYQGHMIRENSESLPKRIKRGYLIKFSSNAVKSQKKGNKRIAIDAYPYKKGVAIQRIGGFANHSSTSQNAVTREKTHLDDNNPTKKYYKMFMYAIRDIKRGEEILWDYGDDYWKTVHNEKSSPSSSSENVDVLGEEEEDVNVFL
jgi:hypothetical protein